VRPVGNHMAVAGTAAGTEAAVVGTAAGTGAAGTADREADFAAD